MMTIAVNVPDHNQDSFYAEVLSFAAGTLVGGAAGAVLVERKQNDVKYEPFLLYRPAVYLLLVGTTMLLCVFSIKI